MGQKVGMVKTTVLSLCEQLFGALTHAQFFNSDINLFLIDDVWCKLCNIWLLPCDINSRSITILELNYGGKHYCNTQDRVIDDNLKRQIKNQILFTYRLFLPIYIFQYICNWAKVFQLLPTLLVQYTQLPCQSIFFFHGKQFFS